MNMLKVFNRSMCSISLKQKPPLTVFGIEGRYVSALYSAAHTSNSLEKVEDGLKRLLPELTKPKMMDFIETSIISRNDKAKLLTDFGSAASFPTEATNFLALVAENGRLKKLRRMITMFLQVMVAHRKEALCEVITAKPLDESFKSSLLEALKKLAKGRNISMTEKVDPSIIGGVIVVVEDKVIDLSIARKIQMYTDILKQSV
ncbi:ATP synthase delta (OSCP) subunit domain-containing protein [Phthorimaea operculella]|nr:ATP synthase delta (OSCP) subunit domain-containing protein [Phthorimaea operculella]